MAGIVRPRGRTLGLAALALMAVGSPVAAQPPKVLGESGTTVYLVVRTKSTVPENRVTGTVSAGLKASQTTIDGKPGVKPVSPLFFEQFAELIGSPRKVEVIPPDGAGVGIKPLPSRDTPLHEVRLPSAKQSLTSLKVKYNKPAEGADEPTDEYNPMPPGEGPLTMIEPGRYAFRPDTDRTPLEFTAVVDERDETTRELVRGKELKGKWPDADKFYVVTLKNFRDEDGGRADHETLLKAVEEAQAFEANPLTISRLGGDQVFLFADLTGGGIKEEDDDTVGINTLTLRKKGLPDRSTKRVWMLFPLTEEEAKEAAVQYGSADTKELPNLIRKNAVPDSEMALFTPESKPQWIELPATTPDSNAFARQVKIENQKELYTKFPTLWRLTVWEFERAGPGGEPVREAILTKDENDADTAALASPIKSWTQ